MENEDFRKYYDLERYLFEDVTARFHKNDSLDAFDFFCIIIWKANRAKPNIARRLMSSSRGKLRTEFATVDEATQALTGSIAQAPDNKSRLRILLEDWGFRLPMASAILTVLYPEEFTVYDMRVCGVLNDFHKIQNLVRFASIWTEYEKFLQAVREAVKGDYSLRDKDRWLWGKSRAEELREDIASGFRGRVHSPAARDVPGGSDPTG
jgi:hypothetical protein